MLHRIRLLYDEIKKLHDTAIRGLQTSSAELSRTSDIKEFCDYDYALKEIKKLVEDLESEVNKRITLVENAVCQFAVQQNIIGPIETEYVTATPKPQVGVSLPGYKKDRPAFDKLMQDLQVPESMWKDLERPMVRLDYPSIMQYVSGLLEAGRPIPQALRSFKRSPVLTVSIRSRKEVDAASEQKIDDAF